MRFVIGLVINLQRGIQGYELIVEMLAVGSEGCASGLGIRSLHQMGRRASTSYWLSNFLKVIIVIGINLCRLRYNPFLNLMILSHKG